MNLATLHQSPLFKDVTNDVINDLAGKTLQKNYSRHEYVYHKGETPQGIYFIEQGKIAFIMPDYDGREQFLALASDGHFFGTNEVLGKHDCFADARAFDATSCLFLARKDFLELFASVPQVAQNLAEFLAFSTQVFQNLLVNVQKLPLPSRLANLLLEHHYRFAAQSADGLRLTHEELAFMTNSSRQSVAKALSVWQQNGWINYSYGKLKVLDATALMSARNPR